MFAYMSERHSATTCEIEGYQGLFATRTPIGKMPSTEGTGLVMRYTGLRIRDVVSLRKIISQTARCF